MQMQVHQPANVSTCHVMLVKPNMSERPSAFQTQQRQLDFASVKRACPKGVYLAPTPRDPNVWQGVLFVRKGPYAPAILKFKILLSSSRPPVIAISTDIFHPLVTPLTTYTYTNSDTGADTVSASDEERLPPGGFSLRHGFPEWFGLVDTSSGVEEAHTRVQEEPSIHVTNEGGDDETTDALEPNASETCCGAIDIARVLFYMRSAFDSETLLDKVPITAAGNPGAWHAWQAHRAKSLGSISHATQSAPNGSTPLNSMRQQPGGARRPGQWNWEGVWEERVKKGINASISQNALFSAGQDSDLINFLDVDPALLEQAVVWKHSVDMEADTASIIE